MSHNGTWHNDSAAVGQEDALVPFTQDALLMRHPEPFEGTCPSQLGRHVIHVC
jgi:hypothetical protein